ncbi:MAG: hypothetical protein LAO55_26375 [Acidobacteriia bacterium]|nr:hypothetical protein [Terriglobia bacterium]
MTHRKPQIHLDSPLLMICNSVVPMKIVRYCPAETDAAAGFAGSHRRADHDQSVDRQEGSEFVPVKP